MSANGYRVGGEQSGHIIFRKYATTGDGILTAIKMMEVMLEKKKTLAELAAPVPVYPQVLKNIRVTDKAGSPRTIRTSRQQSRLWAKSWELTAASWCVRAELSLWSASWWKPGRSSSVKNMWMRLST